ncbi:aldo/keto reductase [Pseudarthrobacter sp. J1763]|uniref:aldo/keto reductase n=1 Tax=Pseudarthrobacter sp. J1763 TaxID=3420445 RepID=UPI003D2B8977
MRLSPKVALNNGVLIDQLGFGLYKVPSEDARSLVFTALQTGYRHVDTATLYGNEMGTGQVVGMAGDVPHDGRQLGREDIFVTSKLWNDDQGYDSTLRAFDESMSRLGLQYLDMYLIHWPVPGRGLFVESYRAMETLYNEGRVRAIGVSNFQPEHLERLLEASTVVPAVNQVELHPWLQQNELRNLHDSLGIKTEAWSPLGRGKVLEDPTIGEIAAQHQRTPAQIILRWHMHQGNIAIPKASSAARMRENLNIFDFELSALDLAAIAALDRGFRSGSDPNKVV